MNWSLRNAAAGRLTFASDLGELNNGVEAVFIAVGTPPSSIDQSADLSSVFAVARDVARAASSGLVIVTKSTVPVGTGDEIARHHARDRARRCGSASPRTPNSSARATRSAISWLPTGSLSESRTIMRATSLKGPTRHSLPAALRLLSTSRRAAELVKYASNCFLATKISFINEVADLCEAVDADIDEVAAGMGLDRRIGSAFLKRRSRLRRLLLPQGLRRHAGHGGD